jgi:hypothetical protein
MQSDRLVSLDHSEIVSGVQTALAKQLQRDGRLEKEMELGLLFYAKKPDDLSLVAKVSRHGKVLFELKGGRPHLAAVAIQLALDKLSPLERCQLEPQAQVRWRAIKFTGDESTLERFMVDVEFRKR